MRRAVVWILAHVFRSSFSECSTVGATCRTLSQGGTMIEKLEKVEGAVGKENDLVLKPAESSDVEEVVVFFGGDTQVSASIFFSVVHPRSNINAHSHKTSIKVCLISVALFEIVRTTRSVEGV